MEHCFVGMKMWLHRRICSQHRQLLQVCHLSVVLPSLARRRWQRVLQMERRKETQVNTKTIGTLDHLNSRRGEKNMRMKSES